MSLRARLLDCSLRAALVLLLLLLPCVVHAEDSASRDLTPEEFTTTVFSKPTFVKFFAPWCGHCKALAPVWEEAAKLVHREYPNIQLVGMDCVAHGDVCSKFGVRGYPTLIYIRPSQSDAELLAISRSNPAGLSSLTRQVYSYGGARSALALEHFVTNQEEWSRVTPVTYPLPIVPVAMQLVEREEQLKAQVDAQVNGQSEPPPKTIDRVKAGVMKGVEGSLGGAGAVSVLNRVAGMLKEKATENATEAAHDVASTWLLNTLLGAVTLVVVGALIVLYVTKNSVTNPNKLV